MAQTDVKVYRYRWVVLAAFMLINVVIQVLWICYAPVASIAAAAYGVSRESVDLLAYLFMLIYVPVTFAASWAIDSFGFKRAVGLGAVLMAVFGLLRAAFPASYAAALVGSIGLSVAQPFLLNAYTKFAADWFPREQRATITGVVFLSLFLGIGLGEATSPAMVAAYGFGEMQLVYGVAAAAAAALFLALARAKPPTPPGLPGEEVRALALDGLKRILRNRDVYLLSLALFLGSGIVNGIFTLIDGLGREKALTVDQGVLLASVLLLGGVVGCVAIPAISDAIRRRKAVLVTAVLLGVPATLGLVLGSRFPFELAAVFVLGFVITGAVPVAYQYGAEITHPAPEATSNGVFALVVQASGVLILLMDALKGVFGGSYLPPLLGLAVLMGASGVLLAFARESPAVRGAAAGTAACKGSLPVPPATR